MGRPVFFRQRVRQEAQSVAAKTFFDYVVNYVRERREIAVDEAELLAGDVMRYLHGYLGLQSLGQIEFPAVVHNREAYIRRPRDRQQEMLVRLTVLQDDDAELLGEFGTRTMVTGRIARLIEEAYYQGALLDIPRLLVLFPSSVQAIRKRWLDLVQQGARLPLAAMTKKTREHFRYLRPALAVWRYLQGEDLKTIRQTLCISQRQWQAWWNAFRQIQRYEEAAEAAEATGYALPLVEEWREIWNHNAERVRKTVADDLPWPWERADAFLSRSRFVEVLQERHGYSPAAADAFVQELREISERFHTLHRSGGQIVYIGVSSAQGAGKSLKESTLQPVVLDLVKTEDWADMDPKRPGALRWNRIARVTTQAYEQGAALTLPDIGYIISLSSDGVRKTMEQNPKVVLPTRGRVADMGATLSHAAKIIDLFMWGYTETEITRRTGHSYESIERYLLDFSKVVLLKEEGLPLPEIRKVCDLSKRVVQKYWELHDAYDTSDFQFAMSKIRRFAIAHPPRNKQRERGERKDEGG